MTLVRLTEKWKRQRPKTASERKLIRARLAMASRTWTARQKLVHALMSPPMCDELIAAGLGGFAIGQIADAMLRLRAPAAAAKKRKAKR